MDVLDELTRLRDEAQAEVERLNDALRAYKGHKRPGRPVRARVGDPEPAGARRRSTAKAGSK